MSCTNDAKLEAMLIQLQKDVEKLMNTTTAKLLVQDGKIAEVCNYIKNNLSASIISLLGTMKATGELDDIITDAVTAAIADLQNETYYDSEIIRSERFTDDVTGSDYYVTIVKRRDKCGNPVELRLGVGNDKETLTELESPVNFAHRTNASLVVNGGIYNVYTNKALGAFIKDGKILSTDPLTDKKYSYLAIDKFGNLSSYDYSTSAETMLKRGVKNAMCCFTTLIVNSLPVELADTTNYDPRNAIGQLPSGDYIIVTVDGRTRDNIGFRYQDLTRIFQKYDARFAIALDGGGSASTVVRGVKQNDDIDSSFNDRPVSNFLYIVKPNNTNPSLNPFNAIGHLKQRIMKHFNTLINFEKGYIRVRAPKGQHWPGMEIYTNGEIERAAKIGFTSDPNVIRRILFSMKVNGEERNVFAANELGLFDGKGLLASFNAVPELATDVNTINKSGVYRCNGSTLNKPYDCVIGFCVHLSYNAYDAATNGNSKQFFFSKDLDVILTRNVNNNGTFTDWRVPCNLKGGTSNRPNGVTGMMFFDTTIGKPIWYNGTKWVDANGADV